MPSKINPELTKDLKTPLKVSDHARLYQYAEMIATTKRKAAAKILSEFLMKHVKLDIEQ